MYDMYICTWGLFNYNTIIVFSLQFLDNVVVIKCLRLIYTVNVYTMEDKNRVIKTELSTYYKMHYFSKLKTAILFKTFDSYITFIEFAKLKG